MARREGGEGVRSQQGMIDNSLGAGQPMDQYNIMHNNNNNRSAHSPKASARSAYFINDRLHSKHYMAKMATVRRAPDPKAHAYNHTRIHDQSTILANKPTPLPMPSSLKQQFDSFVKTLFRRLDFENGGFVSASKISREKSLTEAEFYFFGGVFQKIRQVGAVTERIFISLCDQLYLHASGKDIRGLLNGGRIIIGQATMRKKGKKKGGRSFKSCASLKHQKSVSKMEYLPHVDRTPLKQSKIHNTTLPKKQSLKRYLQSAQRIKLKPQRQASSSLWDHSSSDQSLGQTKKVRQENTHFDSLRVRQLSERLDRQILQSQTRISLNRYLR